MRTCHLTEQSSSLDEVLTSCVALGPLGICLLWTLIFSFESEVLTDDFITIILVKHFSKLLTDMRPLMNTWEDLTHSYAETVLPDQTSSNKVRAKLGVWLIKSLSIQSRRKM